MAGSFNRYIVECKCRRYSVKNKIFIVLIDTQWNVNTNATMIFISLNLVLIDT